jgi:transposase
MKKYSEAFVGIDTAKKKHAVAIAEDGRNGEIRYLGEIDSSPATVEKVIGKLAERYAKLHVCYEAGPTEYGLYRQVKALGHECAVVAPSLIVRKPGKRIKTNRRDAVTLARLLRAGDLTSVWVPDAIHEAVRDLSRAREAAGRTCARNANSSCHSCCVMVGSSAAASIGAWPVGGGSPSRSSRTRHSRSSSKMPERTGDRNQWSATGAAAL